MLFCESSNQIFLFFVDLVGTFAIFCLLFTKSVKKRLIILSRYLPHVVCPILDFTIISSPKQIKLRIRRSAPTLFLFLFPKTPPLFLFLFPKTYLLFLFLFIIIPKKFL